MRIENKKPKQNYPEIIWNEFNVEVQRIRLDMRIELILRWYLSKAGSNGHRPPLRQWKYQENLHCGRRDACAKAKMIRYQSQGKIHAHKRYVNFSSSRLDYTAHWTAGTDVSNSGTSNLYRWHIFTVFSSFAVCWYACTRKSIEFDRCVVSPFGELIDSLRKTVVTEKTKQKYN